MTTEYQKQSAPKPALSYSLPVPPRDVDANGVISAPDGYHLSNGALYAKYPRADVSTGAPILSALGSFWSRHFQDRGTLLGVLRGDSQRFIQAYMNYLEAVACTSRFSCPIWHRKIWYALTIKESELDTGYAAVIKYGDSGIRYDATYRYGVASQDEFHTVQLQDIEHIGVVLNRILDPSLTWVNGIDFFMENGALFFRSNPFKDSRLPVSNVLDSVGNVIDREVVLWGFNVLADWEYLYEHYGYALRRKLTSSISYSNFINSLWNGFVGGLAAADLDWALAAIAGLPMVKEASETIEAILTYPTKVVVCSNHHCYIYPAGSQVNVTVGQTVYAGQTLVDTVSVFDLANYDDVVALLRAVRITDEGEAVTRYIATLSSSSSASGEIKYVGIRKPSAIKPSATYLPMLHTLPIMKSLLGTGYYGSLGFRNEIGSVDVATTDSNGRIKAKIVTLDGDDDDVDRLWDTAHTNGLAVGKTWLEYQGAVPAYVNPAGWAIEHFLRNNALVVYLRYTKFGSNALGLNAIETLRQVLPPEKVVLYVVEAEATTAEDLNYEQVYCGDSSSSATTQCAVDAANAGTTESAISAGVDIGSSSSSGSMSFTGFLGDLEPTVFYPVDCD